MNHIHMPLFTFLFCLCTLMPGQDMVSKAPFHVLDMRDGLSESRIRQIQQMPDGRIAIATTSTIDIYDGTRFTSIQLHPSKSHPLPGYTGRRQLTCDTLGYVWLRNEGTLYVVDSRNGRLVDDIDSLTQSLHLTNEDIVLWPKSDTPSEYGGIHDVIALAHDRYGGIWIGTKERGLLYSNPLRSRQFQTIAGTDFDYPRIPNHATARTRRLEERYAPHATNCMLDDHQDYAYLGTLNGIMIFDDQDHPVCTLDDRFGLHTNNIQSLIRDENGDIWASTSSGISRIHVCGKDSFAITNYGKLDGIDVKGQEFRPCQMHKDSTGLITVGFVGGVVRFHPDSISAPRYTFYYPPTTSLPSEATLKPTKRWLFPTILVILICIIPTLILTYRKKRGNEEKARMAVPQISEKGFEKLKEQTNKPSADEEFLQKIQETVESNIGDEHFSVQSLSEEMAMDRTGLYRRMHQLTGMSPSNYIRQIRMDIACRLLCETELSVSEIAARTGFSTTKYFNKVFKERFTTSPDAYRAQHHL